MTARFLDLLAQLPSVQAFIQRIVEDLTYPLSVIVLVPRTIDPNWLWTRLEAELWSRGGSMIEQVNVASLDCRDGTAAALGQALNVPWGATSSARDVAALLSCRGLPEIIKLNGIESLDQRAQEQWLRLVDQWAQISQNLGSPRSQAVLCAVLQPADLAAETIDSNVKVAVHWWWGLPSLLEQKLLCRLAGADRSLPVSYLRWLEYLIPGLANGDLTMLDRLWSGDIKDVEQVKACVKELADERGWTYHSLRQWGISELVLVRGRQSTKVPRSAFVLWAHGIVHATEEYGIELHPAALWALARKNELDHRIWRGQADLLLPILDGIRLDLCTYLTHRYGADWPIRWAQPDHADEEAAVRENPLACQFGYMEWLIRTCDRLKSERRWLSLITPAAKIRNEIAHYRTISFMDFENMIEKYGYFMDSYRQMSIW